MNHSKPHPLSWLPSVFAATVLAPVFWVTAAMAHGNAAAYVKLTERPAAVITIPDHVELRNQHGAAVNFANLVKNKVVAINTIFTTCTTICSTAGLYFSRLSRPEFLGERVGQEVRLISITVDPAVDTPTRLAAWSAKLGAGPGWTLLTGSKPVIDDLLRSLRMYTPDKFSHAPVVLVGKQSSGEWVHTDGLAPPRYLAQSIKALLPPR